MLRDVTDELSIREGFTGGLFPARVFDSIAGVVGLKGRVMVLERDVQAYDLVEVTAAGPSDSKGLAQVQDLRTASVVSSTALSKVSTSTRSSWPWMVATSSGVSTRGTHP